jgi:hydroxyacyl-ACP dehydratase HTD2-like protein with hotdog domain
MTGQIMRRFADVRLGEELPSESHVVTRVTLFLFGIAYFTPHRIHYDVEYARGEGFDDVLVTANLLSAYSADLLARWAGDAAAVRSLEERNVAPATAGDALVVGGRVSDLEPGETGGLVWCDLYVNRADGARVIGARASLQLP